MTPRPSCPICAKRRSERFCPAKSEKICAVCCGTERETTLDCPVDCAYLIAAHRYELAHRKPVAASEVPFPDTEFPSDLIYQRQPFISGLGYSILKFATEHRELVDRDALTAITSLGETYRTLLSGIYYEKPPEAPLANELYTGLASFIQEFKKQEGERGPVAALKDSEIFYALVYLARVCRGSTNGRPRARLFLEFLRARFPQAKELQPETSRIIVP
jgi:hypothetical protein